MVLRIILYTMEYLVTVVILGFGQSAVDVMEDAGLVQVCFITFSSISTCPVEFPFKIILTTTDETASNL